MEKFLPGAQPGGCRFALMEFAMSVRVKKIHPALKHEAYSATAFLPREDAAAFEKLRQDLIAELRPMDRFRIKLLRTSRA